MGRRKQILTSTASDPLVWAFKCNLTQNHDLLDVVTVIMLWLHDLTADSIGYLLRV